jgi:hypothetical protein
MKMRFVLLLLFITLSRFIIDAQTGAISSFQAKPAELKIEMQNVIKDDYIELSDEKDSVRVFSIGDIVYLAYYDPSLFIPDPSRTLTYWVLWPVLSLDTLSKPSDSSAKMFFQADMDFVTLSSRKILKLEWIYKNDNKKFQLEKQGLQLWDLHTATCYFNALTRNYEKTLITNKTDACYLKTSIENDRFVISINGCNKALATGKYKLKEMLVAEN